MIMQLGMELGMKGMALSLGVSRRIGYEMIYTMQNIPESKQPSKPKTSTT